MGRALLDLPSAERQGLTIAADGKGIEFGWDYRVGSEPVRTVDVPLADLAARLGSPLGDPLRDIG